MWHPALQVLASKWSFIFPDAVLSYLVVDEADNWVIEQYRVDILKKIAHGDFSSFAKILLFSGTIFPFRYQQVLNFLRFTGKLISNPGLHNSSNILLWNTIEEIPLTKVYKQFPEI